MSQRQRLVFVGILMTALLFHGLQWAAVQKKISQWQSEDYSILVPRGSVAEAAGERKPEAPLDEEKAELDDHCCDRVHINWATLDELMTLPGIGPVYAQNIIDERKKQYFIFAEELLRVRGIGPVRLEALLPLICLAHPDGSED